MIPNCISQVSRTAITCKLFPPPPKSWRFCLYTASQMWCLARYLPLMIGDVIPQDDDHWENFLVFLDLMDYVFAPTTTPEKIAYVAVLVEDYLTEFSHLYERRLTPKMHYLVHLSTWMTR